MRLFIGLPVPTELALALVQLTQALELSGSRLTPRENMHLTLIFLGEVAEWAVPSIERELAELSFASFPLRITGLNAFSRAGILFAEIEAVRPLLDLQSRVADGMVRCGFAREDRPYRPHLTLARLRGPLRLGKWQQNLPTSLQRSFSADAVNLYRSHLTPGGSRYEVLAWRAAG